jgi:hypothetical protein
VSKASKKSSKKRLVKSISRAKAVPKKPGRSGSSGGPSGPSGPGNPSGPGGPGGPAAGGLPHAAFNHADLLAMIQRWSAPVGQCSTAAYLADYFRVSISTIYNHIRQMYRDGLPIYRTIRGFVYGEDATLEDMAKVQRRMTGCINGVAIEANAVCAPTATAWNNSHHPDRVVMVGITNRIVALHHPAWTRDTHAMFNIVDTF